MQGRVVLRRRDLALRTVRFTVPGVTIDAAGGYGLVSERLDFHGIARLDASVSRTQTGARRVLMRPLDPLLSKDGAGTRLVDRHRRHARRAEGGRRSGRVAARQAVIVDRGRGWGG